MLEPIIDVSGWQGEINWEKAKERGVLGAFIRQRYGLSIYDKYFDRNWAETKRLGIPRGAYHFLLAESNIKLQALRFVEALKDDPGELPPVCDVEAEGVGLAAVQMWCAEVELALGRKPLIYTSPGFWQGLKGSALATWAADYDLWVAHYTTKEQPIVPKPWTKWTFWQYSSNGPGEAMGMRSKGLDMNRFNGDLLDYNEYIGVGEIYKPEEPLIPNEPPNTDITQRLAALEDWARNIGYKS